MSDDRIVKTVDKALRLLKYFETNDCLGLTELARRSGYSKATTYRLLCTLEKHGFLKRTLDFNDTRYRLGLRLLELGNLVKERLELRRVALPQMVRLRDRVGDSVQLVVRDELDGIYIEVVESKNPVRLYIRPGRRAPLYAGASTRLLLAYLPEEEIDRILQICPPRAHTPNTITDVAVLKKVLAKVKERGFALSKGELAINSAELAVPLFDSEGQVVAALSLAGSDHNYHGTQLREFLTAIKDTARIISKALGYRGD
ncbi:IclR family transcriptional regulator [Calderihabitans maritimus]|uniref:IclR family transcriptional regulator n=1 Tax=Calderihabitans maritimus TaxID=1246530 RepID=UPI00186439DF|nr:IclR family transcriptional regulator [Calderihabitans maritimus]